MYLYLYIYAKYKRTKMKQRVISNDVLYLMTVRVIRIVENQREIDRKRRT